MLTETCRPLRVACARIVLICLTAATLPGCGVLYVAQAARGQWQVMHARQPIDKVIASDRTAPQLRDRLTEVRAARDFASRELALPDNGSYRSYADLERPYVVWNVVAAPEFSVNPRRWCFPIAGCVAYRGYFKEEKARQFADSLAKEGFDTYVGGVAAYSTLGKFKDPVLNTMLGYGDDELAAIIFHELSHQLIYVANDSEFNEAFATAVEQAGLERWLKARGRESDLGRFKARRERQAQIIALFIGAMSRSPTSKSAWGFARAIGTRRKVSTTPISRRSPPITTACRASSDCSPATKATCRSSTTPCASSRRNRAKSGTSCCA
jgi:predicted aminopeptidase